MQFWLLNGLKEKISIKIWPKTGHLAKLRKFFLNIEVSDRILKSLSQQNLRCPSPKLCAVCHWWVLFNDNLFIAIVVLLHPLCHFPSIFQFLAPPQRSPQASFPLSFGPLPTVPVLHPLSQLFCANSFWRLPLHLCWSGPHWSSRTSASSLGPNLSCWAWCPWCWGCFFIS